MAFSPPEVQKALRGADYPATGTQLAQLAERNGAGRDLVETIKNLDSKTYDGPDKVMEALKGELGGGR
jgi:hypothetical protein